METHAIILAAGKGARMHSELPKCAHLIIDKPMVMCVLDTLRELGIKEVITVVGYKGEIVKQILEGKCDFAFQAEQKGTGHAVNMTRDILEGKKGTTIIAAGDMPLVRKETYQKLIDTHVNSESDITILTAIQANPNGYGRIIRDNEGNVLKIVEEKDCNDEERKVNEVNTSIYAANNEMLFKLLDEVKNNNCQNEYYLTDIIAIGKSKNLKIETCIMEDAEEMDGINTQEQLQDVNKCIQKCIIRDHINNGVIFEDPEDVTIGVDVKIDKGVKIKKGECLLGATHITK